MIRISVNKNSKNKKISSRKTIKILIFILIALSATLAAVPTVFQQYHNSYSKEIIYSFQNIYIGSFIVLSVILGLLSLFFPNDFKAAEKIANKKLYDDSNLKSEVPSLVWRSLLGILAISLLIGWIFVR